jgi:hypothetical protein
LTKPEQGGISRAFGGAIAPPGHAIARRIGFPPEERG